MLRFEQAPQKLFHIIGLLFVITTIGTLGYHFIEGWEYFDAAYMTIITLATVGYGETHPLSHAGRTFTMFLIMGGMGFILYSITEATAFLVEGEMTGYLRRRRMARTINKLHGHYILCGCGLKGQHILDELTRTRRRCVVVENHPEKVRRLLERRALVIEGDATDDTVLRMAGIERAAGLVAALPTDKDNLFVVITARGLNKDLRIVAKVDDLDARDKFIRSGANSVVSANFIGGMRMASELIRPDTVSFLDSMLRDQSDLRVEDVYVSAESRFADTPLEKCAPLQSAGVLLFSVKHQNGYRFNPPPETVIHAGDTLVVIGYPDQISRIRQAFEGSSSP